MSRIRPVVFWILGQSHGTGFYPAEVIRMRITNWKPSLISFALVALPALGQAQTNPPTVSYISPESDSSGARKALAHPSRTRIKMSISLSAQMTLHIA